MAAAMIVSTPDTAVGDPAVPTDLAPVPMTLRTGDTVATGTVRSVGAAPLTQVVLQSGAGAEIRSVAVRGELRDEIARAIGAEVRVWGPPAANQPPPPARAVEVYRYDILSVNGEIPVVGTVFRRGEQLLIGGRDTVDLVGAPEELLGRLGAKVWAVGVREGSTLRIQAYGVLREVGR
jgi:hypothetical protein